MQITYSLGGVSWTSSKHDGFTVRKPSSITKSPIENHGGDIDAEGKPFYLSQIYWLPKDQFGDTMIGVSANETFGTFTSSAAHPTENWPQPEARGGSLNANGFFEDTFWVKDILGALNPPLVFPQQGALTQDLIQSAPQSYFVGSVTPGQGCLLKTGTILYYIDHANHQ